MTIRLSDDEVWDELAAAHTGIFTTLRADGWPVSLPVWFAALGRRIYLRTPGRSKKVARIRRDPRASFLVESGERWAELRAVQLPVHAVVLDDGPEAEAAAAALATKYAGFGIAMERAPSATQKAYRGMTFIRLEPAGKALTWDNARIQLQETSA